ncbi:MAG: serine/threonine-protein phosphatase [Ruminococcus sp.]|nr:serine/threonine-protein phosphatase [Ruminococcus sp.]
MKKRKLMIQVSILVVISFILGGILSVFLVYRSATRIYLTAKQDMIDRDLDHISRFIEENPGYHWFLDYARDHYEEIIARKNDDNTSDTEWEEFQNKTGLKHNAELTQEEIYEAIDKKASDEEKQFYSSSVYEGLAYALDYDNNDFGYGNMYVMTLDDDSGFVYYQADDYGGLDRFLKQSDIIKEGLKLGDTIDIDIDNHPALEKIVSGKSDKTEFEIFEGKINNLDYNSHYTAYRPVMFRGRLQAVLVIDYNWDEFRKELIGNIEIMVSLMLAGLVIFCGVIILRLNRVAVMPLSRLQNAVNEYGKTKDCSKAAENIGKIRSFNEIGKLAKEFSEMTVEIDNYMKENMKLVKERERVAAEMELAAKLQADMLPGTYPAFPQRHEFDIYATMSPAKEVGGDFYDFFLVDEDHLALTMADVSGKGIPAALFMMITKILIQNFAMTGLSPAQVLKKTNEIICQKNEEQMFVTVWFGILEISTGRITAVNAGHEYPIIKTAEGGFEIYKDKRSIAVGDMDITKFNEYEFELEKGGTLFLYTDGVTEAFDKDEEMFGKQRLLDTLNKHTGSMPIELLSEVRTAVDSFAGEIEQFDDITMLGITLV